MATLTAHRRFQRLAILAFVFIIITYLLLDRVPRHGRQPASEYVRSSFDWANRRQKHAILESTMVHLPDGIIRDLPRIQHEFSKDEPNEAHNKTQRQRQEAVRNATRKSWDSYREYAWGSDELAPLTLVGKESFSGWGATLVDSLDTLWIMGLKKEFAEAVDMVATIDWDNSTATSCSLFETNIRYLGGLLATYDLSQEEVLLQKAVELGNMLYAAFDTPNHFPANAFDFEDARDGRLVADKREASAAVGSLSLEFTRLSQITGDPKYYSVIDNIKTALERTQDTTTLPGMWPTYIDLRNGFLVTEGSYSLGAMSDSAYEYLSKMFALLGGLDPTYEKLHIKAMETVKKHLLFRPMLPDIYPAVSPDILFSGTALSNGPTVELWPDVQHLGCFAGGMFALGGRMFHREDHVTIGEQLARGCAWAYDAFPTGVMPEVSRIVPCETADLAPCNWNESRGRKDEDLPKPFSGVQDAQYLLRPEAIESVFILYRITGKRDLLDTAWRMFNSIVKATETKFAYSAISNVQAGGGTSKINSMESFWIAETLKYFYLIFSEPDVISLDEYVFNTEAHPLKLPKAAKR